MNILEITHKHQDSDPTAPLRSTDYCRLRQLPSSGPGFLTAMSIASAYKHEQFEFVIAHRIKDLCGALSARTLCRDRGGDFHIIANLEPGHMPRSMARDLVRGIDAWVLSESDAATAAMGAGTLATLKNVVYIGPEMTAAQVIWTQRKTPAGDNECEPQQATQHETFDILWHGPLTSAPTASNMIEALLRIEQRDPALAQRMRLTVSGQGPARYVMPVVRATRRIKLATVIWAGDGTASHSEATHTETPYTLVPHPEGATDSPAAMNATAPQPDTELRLPRPDAIIYNNPMPDDVFIAAVKDGVPYIDPRRIASTIERIEYLATATPAQMLRERQDARELYEQRFDPLFHVKQWGDLLNLIR